MHHVYLAREYYKCGYYFLLIFLAVSNEALKNSTSAIMYINKFNIVHNYLFEFGYPFNICYSKYKTQF